jgi:hypothetical protein
MSDVAPRSTKSIVNPVYRDRYGTAKHNGDEISMALAAYTKEGRHFNMDKIVEVADANGLKEKLVKWANLNNGQVRMLLGASLRTLKRRGTDVQIGEQTILGDPVVEKPAKERKARDPAQPRVPRKTLRDALGLPPVDAEMLNGSDDDDEDEDDNDAEEAVPTTNPAPAAT